MLNLVCKQLDEYCEKNNKKVVMCAVEIDENGNAETIVFHRISNPIPALGMISMIKDLLEGQEMELKEHTLKSGFKSDSTEKNGEVIIELIRKFEALRNEGDKIKDQDPIRLVQIVTELKSVIDQIRNLDSKRNSSDKKDNSNHKDDFGNALDDFKDMF